MAGSSSHRSGLLVGLISLILLPSLPAEGGEREAFSAIQPALSREGLVLLTREGEARIERPDGSLTRVPLRKRERLSALGEIRGGWVAAGWRETGRGTDLVVIQEGLAGRTRTPPPAAVGGLRIAPVLLVDREELVGLAWLEGDEIRGLAVRMADWTGIDWGPARTVSPAGPGSQTGLAGAVLGDGTVLLAWSRFDGEDDEIFWSHRRGDGFSTPRRLTSDNRVPDVTPALISTGRGALLAWSRIDGEGYRLMTSAFSSGRWSAAEPAAETGSLFPSFHRTEAGLFLLYRSAQPRGWSVGEIEESGRVGRRARQETAEAERPVLGAPDDSAIGLRWPRDEEELRARWEAGL